MLLKLSNYPGVGAEAALSEEEGRCLLMGKGVFSFCRSGSVSAGHRSPFLYCGAVQAGGAPATLPGARSV